MDLTASAFTFFAALIYLLPTLVGRGKRNAVAIAVLNIMLGWTVVGWIAALVWACTADEPRSQPQIAATSEDAY
jgi:nitric oxide reductase large subunit